MTIYRNRADYTPPPCPHCSGPAEVSWVDLEVNFKTVGSVVTSLRCKVRCYQQAPDDYLAAIVDHPTV